MDLEREVEVWSFKLLKKVLRAATDLGVHPMFILKTLALDIGNSKIFFVTDGNSQVDFQDIATKLNVEKVVLDKSTKYESIFPFQEMENIKVYFNESILSLNGDVYVESGYNKFVMFTYKMEDVLKMIPKENVLKIQKTLLNGYNFFLKTSLQTVKIYFV
jgi:prolyl-tRNA editing enzyme YbaK/EbsC (Cys-tRNA(Pro) deacylase)